jgi:hypothetical protein
MAGNEKEFVFRTKDADQTKEWMKEIHSHLTHSKGKLL